MNAESMRSGWRERLAIRGALWLALLLTSMAPALAGPPQAVPTFESIGLSWDPDGGSSSTPVTVRFRVAGTSGWKTGHPLWFDAEDLEYRGSLVHLEPGTVHDIELTRQGLPTTFQASTWSETFPVGSSVFLPATSSSTLSITQGGSPSGYRLYTHAPGSTTTIDIDGSADRCITVSASYVIIRELVLRGSNKDCILLQSGVTDVVIEENDISDWGTGDYESAVRGEGSSIKRIIVQRNRIHDPRQDTNSWCETTSFSCSSSCDVHPVGPYGVRLKSTGGNHVVRYNTFSSTANWLQDGISIGDTTSGANDNDIYGNRIEQVWDNPIESEADNRNVRIWGNLFDHSYAPIALVPSDHGPIYIWRNVFGYNNRKGPENCTGSTDSDPRGRAFKTGYRSGGGGGRTYIYHNTILHAPAPPGLGDALGVDDGIITGASDGNADNMVTRNNIFYARDDALQAGGGNDYDYDLHRGDIPSGSESNGIAGVAVYDPENAPGEHFLAAQSPGRDAAVVISNFNDGFSGVAPDMGAYETGMAPLQFGVDAYRTGDEDPPTDPPPPPENVAVE